MTWKPTLRAGVDLRALPLSPMQGFVASRLDGVTDVHGLSQITNLPDAQVESLLHELARLGAIDSPAGPPLPISSPPSLPPSLIAIPSIAPVTAPLPPEPLPAEDHELEAPEPDPD